MNLTSVKVGDIVEVDKKGRVFHALVLAKDGELRIRPFDRHNTWTDRDRARGPHGVAQVPTEVPT